MSIKYKLKYTQNQPNRPDIYIFEKIVNANTKILKLNFIDSTTFLQNINKITNKNKYFMNAIDNSIKQTNLLNFFMICVSSIILCFTEDNDIKSYFTNLKFLLNNNNHIQMELFDVSI